MLYQFISTHLYGIYSETEQLKVLQVNVSSLMLHARFKVNQHFVVA